MASSADWDAAPFEEIIERLLATWEQDISIQVTWERAHDVKYVFPFAAHVHLIARATVVLWQAGSWVESAPLVRTCLEGAVSAAWTMKHGAAAAEALDYESNRNLKNAIADVGKAELYTSEELNQLLSAWAEQAKPALAPQSKHFQQMCDGLNGGPLLYSIYRYLCQMTHPLGMTREYVPFRGKDGQLHISQKPRPLEDLEKVMLAHTTSKSVAMAAAAVDDLAEGHPRRAELDALAAQIGMTSPRLL